MKGLIDIHAHILPGVDDGASDFQESVRMLKSAYRQGVRCVIATPHYHRNHFHRNPERTMEALQKIRGWLREHLPDMIVLLGTEIYYTIDFAEEITAGNIFPMAKSRYLLVEFSPLEDYAYIRNAVHVLVNRGYCPIIAHAERYRVFHQNVSRVSEVIHLHYDDISRSNMQIHVRDTKNRMDRYTILSKRCLDILTQYWFEKGRPRGILFPNKFTGNYLTVSTLEQVMRRAVADTELPKAATPHCLRHSFATHLMEQGIERQNIQALLGHRDPKSTEVYLHVSNKSLMGIQSPFDRKEGAGHE